MNEAPIQNLNVIDIVGNRHDGGMDLCIVISGFLDSSEEHESLLRQKIQNYVNTIFSEEWKKEHGEKATTILLKSTEAPHQNILNYEDTHSKFCTSHNHRLGLN